MHNVGGEMDELVTLKWADNYAKQNYKAGQIAGIKKVVEYLGDYTKPFPNQREWKSKLKEWGIE